MPLAPAGERASVKESAANRFIVRRLPATLPLPFIVSTIPKQEPSQRRQTEHTVLLAVMGRTPAVLTETVWALAQENIIPDRVIVVTTISGRQAIERELLVSENGRCLWESLRVSILGTAEEDPRLILEPPRLFCAANERTGLSDWLEDIRTPAENRAAADFLLEQIRGQVERPGTRLVASLAGGRKTMSALLYACMTLLARETDRLTHVLVDEAFEDPTLRPRFYYPGQPSQELKSRSGGILKASDAGLLLTDLPFVPLRNRFVELAEMPASFSGLVEGFRRELTHKDAPCAEVLLDHRQRRIEVNGVPIALRAKALTILHYLLERQTQNATPAGQIEAAAEFESWLRGRSGLSWSRALGTDDFKHELSYLRAVLRRHGLRWSVPPRSLRFPPFALSLADGG
jgi:CRISPR-associated protein (TIGR02584 family)